MCTRGSEWESSYSTKGHPPFQSRNNSIGPNHCGVETGELGLHTEERASEAWGRTTRRYNFINKYAPSGERSSAVNNKIIIVIPKQARPPCARSLRNPGRRIPETSSSTCGRETGETLKFLLRSYEVPVGNKESVHAKPSMGKPGTDLGWE